MEHTHACHLACISARQICDRSRKLKAKVHASWRAKVHANRLIAECLGESLRSLLKAPLESLLGVPWEIPWEPFWELFGDLLSKRVKDPHKCP